MQKQQRAGQLTSVLLPHLLNIHLPSFFIAILASRAVVHSFGCILQFSGVFENHDAWSHLQEIRLNWPGGVAGAWGLEQIPGDADLQAVLTARAAGSSFSECDRDWRTAKRHQEMCEECKVLGFTLDLLSEKPWNWIPAMCVLPSFPGDLMMYTQLWKSA